MSQQAKRNKSAKGKKPKQQGKATAQATPKKPATSSKPPRIAWIVLLILGFGLYAQTISHEHALDDKLYITHNKFTKSGTAGIKDLVSNDLLVGFGMRPGLLAGGRYRPFTLMTYAIEWELFIPKSLQEGTPEYVEKVNSLAHFSHGVNAIIYGLCGVLLYLVLLHLFPQPATRKWFLTLPFIVTALYLAHPLHTEVVANIKGRDDLCSLLGSLAALWCAVKWLDTRKMKYMAISAVAILIAFFSKEITATVVPIIFLAIWFFTKHSLKDNIIANIPIGIALLIGIGIRYSVLGSPNVEAYPELMNDPFLYVNEPNSPGTQLATTFFIMAIYFKLLLFPHPLTHDYYPWHPLADDSWQWGQEFPYPTMGNPVALIGLLIFLGIIAFAVWGTFKKHPVAFGIWTFFFPFILFSNLFFSVGIFMNERFMFIPSLGFCFVVGWWLTEKLPKYIKSTSSYQSALTGILVIVLLAYAGKTISRNPAWVNDATLSTTDVEVSRNSAKNNMSAGGGYVDMARNEQDLNLKQQYLNKAIACLNRALQLYPNYYQPMDIMGNAYFQLDDYDNAVIWFDKCLQLKPGYKVAMQNLEIISSNAVNKGRPQQGVKALNTLLGRTTDPIAKARVLGALGQIYGKDLGDIPTSISYLNQSLELDPNNSDNWQKLGVAYAMTNQTQKAIEIFNKALELNPNNANILMNIGIAYKNSGNDQLAEDYFAKAKALDPSLNI